MAGRRRGRRGSCGFGLDVAGGGEGTLCQHQKNYLDADTVFGVQLNFLSLPIIFPERMKFAMSHGVHDGSRCCPFAFSVYPLVLCCLFHLSFLALLPFSFIPYQAVPKTRSGQKVPWAEWKLASPLHLLPVLVYPGMSVRPNMHSLKYNDIVPADTVVVKANTPI